MTRDALGPRDKMRLLLLLLWLLTSVLLELDVEWQRSMSKVDQQELGALSRWGGA